MAENESDWLIMERLTKGLPTGLDTFDTGTRLAFPVCDNRTRPANNSRNSPAMLLAPGHSAADVDLKEACEWYVFCRWQGAAGGSGCAQRRRERVGSAPLAQQKHLLQPRDR